MLNMLYSCFDRTEQSIYDDFALLMAEAENYKNVLGVPDILSDTEWNMLKWLNKSYDMAHKFPSYALFCGQFDGVDKSFQNPSSPLKLLEPKDFRSYIFIFVDARANRYVSRSVEALNKVIAVDGITEEVAKEVERLKTISNRNKAGTVETSLDGHSIYNALKLRPKGMVTGIKAIDERIGGMNEGTMSVIAGFTSQFKSTFALNIAHINSYDRGYNIAYITLETPKQDMYWNLLSCHSYLSKFSKYPYIGHDLMRRAELTAEQEDYLFNTVEVDMKEDEIDAEGNHIPRGKVIFLDESDFKNFSMGEIQQTLSKLDDDLGGNLDAVVVDYIQLCKFSGGNGVSSNEVYTVNAYTSFFRRLSQNFKTYRDASGNEKTKQLIVIVLSQISRDAWRRAVNKNGVYDVTCMSDSSELEKSAFRIFTTFTTEELKERNIAQVQILKNRTGQTMQAEPAEVFVEGAASVFCDEDGMDANVFAGNSQTDAIAATFAGLSSGLSSLL